MVNIYLVIIASPYETLIIIFVWTSASKSWCHCGATATKKCSRKRIARHTQHNRTTCHKSDQSRKQQAHQRNIISEPPNVPTSASSSSNSETSTSPSSTSSSLSPSQFPSSPPPLPSIPPILSQTPPLPASLSIHSSTPVAPSLASAPFPILSPVPFYPSITPPHSGHVPYPFALLSLHLVVDCG